MILVVNLCSSPGFLWYSEFVLPLVEVVWGQGLKTEVRHYKSLERLPQKTQKIILSGAPLKDRDYLNNPDKFSWL
ncbi:MAG: hypothetical protein GF334_09055, partial [Candidatus Altiarchaeales archaeon]|nr:hypothetical protein [Candidatus Altiarchaeales archaeon]